MPLHEVPIALDIEGALTDKPAFAPLSGGDGAQKVEFRRVSSARDTAYCSS